MPLGNNVEKWLAVTHPVASNITFNTKVVAPAQPGQAQTVAPTDTSAPKAAAATPAVVVAEPTVVDTFSGVYTASAPAALTGTEAHPLASRMASNLEGIGALGLADQMQFDLALQLPALLGSPTLGRDVKAARLMEFLTPYAERLASLAQSGVLPADQRSAVAAQLLKPLFGAGLAHVIETTTARSGQQVAETMLAAEGPQAVRKSLDGLRFESTDPNALVGGTAAKLDHSSLVQVAAAAKSYKSAEESAEDEEETQRSRQKQGGALWGALHKGRSEMGRLLDDEKWVPDDKGIYAAAVVALVISIAVAALLTLLR